MNPVGLHNCQGFEGFGRRRLDGAKTAVRRHFPAQFARRKDPGIRAADARYRVIPVGPVAGALPLTPLDFDTSWVYHIQKARYSVGARWSVSGRAPSIGLYSHSVVGHLELRLRSERFPVLVHPLYQVMPEIIDNCTNCDAPQYSYTLDCASCGQRLGFPNVRVAKSRDEVEALDARFDASRARAQQQELSTAFDDLFKLVTERSCVVVSMPAEIALNIVTDANTQFVNYEALVDSGIRQPAAFANDSHRLAVAGALFGSFGDRIRYGALSLSERGLSTYGDVYCLLRSVAVSERTSFLHTNSYKFIERFGATGYPFGYRSDWTNRGKLACSKLEEEQAIKVDQTPADWQDVLLTSDGENRDQDEFIEAHIFGSFNLFSIEKIVPAEPLDKKKKTMVRSIIAAFENAKAQR